MKKYIVAENKYIFDGGKIFPRGWRDLAIFQTLDAARRYLRQFCFGSFMSDFRIDEVQED